MDTGIDCTDLLDLFWNADGSPIPSPPIAKVAPAADKAVKPCRRCSGMGKISGYAHINNGICFRCGGTGRDK